MSQALSTPITLRRRDDTEAGPLATALRARVDGEVRFDEGTRAAYSTDASNFRQVPIGVVIPAPSKPALKPSPSVASTVRWCCREAAARASPVSARTPPS